MSVTESWRAGREAVAQFSLVCAQRGWVFFEVPEQSDFGKDGYVDLTTASGGVPGNCFAVQIKGGRSRWRTDGYRIDASVKQRDRWMRSTLPVVGIAYDPTFGRIHWCDLSRLISEHGVEADLVAPRSQSLDSEEDVKRFVKYIGARTQPQSSILDLVSDDIDRQREAAFVCYFVGREDGRALVLLRRMLFTIQREARDLAVEVLGRAVYHPDMFHTTESLVSKEAAARFATALDWNSGEVQLLLELVDEETGLDRGSIGQTIFQLIVESPEPEPLVGRAAIEAAERGNENVASWALVIALSLAGDNARERLGELLSICPELQSVWATEQLKDILKDSTFINLHN